MPSDCHASALDWQFDRIADSFEELHFDVNQKIVGRGEMGSSFYIILKGSVNQVGADGVLVASKGRCDYFGERR